MLQPRGHAIMTAARNLVCGECGNPVPESALKRKPCAYCGSATLRAETPPAGPFGMRTGVSVKVKNPGDKRPSQEVKAVPEFNRTRRRDVHVERIFDRRKGKDRYFERVTDYKTGEVIRECEGPLSNHINRGNAKKKHDS